MKGKKSKLLLLIIYTLLLCFSCGILSGCNPAAFIKVEEIKLNKDRLYLDVKESEVLMPSVAPNNATNQEVKWKSENEEVAIVENGRVVAKGVGRTNVMVMSNDGKYSSSCEVIVSDNNLYVSKNYNFNTKQYGTKYFDSINFAISASDHNDVIVVEEGVYDEIIAITQPINLRGENAIVNGGVMIGYKKNKESPKNVIISGFIFNDVFVNGEDKGIIKIGADTLDIIIENCIFNGQGQEVNATIEESKLANRSIQEKRTAIMTIATGNTDGIEKIKIRNCKFNDFYDGIYVSPYANNIAIVNNEFNSVRCATLLEGTQRVEIINNKYNDSGVLEIIRSEKVCDLIDFKENEINSLYEGKDNIKLMKILKGNINERHKLDLSKNKFFGNTPKEMDFISFNNLKKLIVVKNCGDACEKELKFIKFA